MKKLTTKESKFIHGGNPDKEIAPVGIIAEGTTDNWAARINVNVPVNDNIIVSPHVVIDNHGGIYKPGVQVTWFFD